MTMKLCMFEKENWANNKGKYSLRSWRDFARECICFGCEAENASGEAVRGLMKSRVEFTRGLAARGTLAHSRIPQATQATFFLQRVRKNVAFPIEAKHYYLCGANTLAFCRCKVVDMLDLLGVTMFT